MLSKTIGSENNTSPEFLIHKQLIWRIFSAVVQSNYLSNNNISIYGPPYIGKTYLLKSLSNLKVQQLFEDESGQNLNSCVFVNINLEAFLQKDFESFFKTLGMYIIEQAQKHLTLTFKADLGAESFPDILNQIHEQGLHPILVMDMFDEIVWNKHAYHILAYLRAQATMGKVSYIIASNKLLYEICHQKIAGSPFFNIFYTYELGVLTEEETLGLLKMLESQAEVLLTEEEIVWLRKEAGRHPFFIQRVCYVLFQEKQQSSVDNVNLQDVRKKTYCELLPYINDIWNKLSEAQRASLQDEAQQKDNKQRTLPELSESAIFRNFVRKTCDVGAIHMSIEELEEALNFINDPARLGETNLRLMKSVANRLDDDVQPTAMEKGRVIREVLFEAFEKMRGVGIRSDRAFDWMNYNILFYRYFHHHLKNTLISSRLGFNSDRQYYRARTKAIEALRNILLEIE